MIEVLQNRQEIDAATLKIQSLCLPLHLDIHKNWDHLLLYSAIATIDKQSQIIDLGCGECCTLNFLAALGFKNLHGIDLQIGYDANTAYTLHQGNLTQTPLVSGECDVAISVSVIEHGVDLAAFFAEVSRLLKTDGLLFVTTDYWSEYIEINSSIQPFGLEWKVFSAPDIEQLIALAQENNLVLAEAGDIPASSDRTVSWYDYKYSFIALLFRKIATSEC